MILPRETADQVSKLFKPEIAEVADAVNDFFRVPTDNNLNAVIDMLTAYQDAFVHYSAVQLQPNMELRR